MLHQMWENQIRRQVVELWKEKGEINEYLCEEKKNGKVK